MGNLKCESVKMNTKEENDVEIRRISYNIHELLMFDTTQEVHERNRDMLFQR